MPEQSTSVTFVETAITASEQAYDAIIASIPTVAEADEASRQYRQEVQALAGMAMSADRIRYYLTYFSQLAYTLGAETSRQKMRADAIKLANASLRNNAYLTADQKMGEYNKTKLIREEKEAISLLAAQDTAVAEAVYIQVSEAVSQRMWSINGYIKSLEIIANMHMSDARITRGQ